MKLIKNSPALRLTKGAVLAVVVAAGAASAQAAYDHVGSMFVDPTGTYDLTDTFLVAEGANISPAVSFAGYTAYVVSGFNSGTWTGFGITSSLAAANSTDYAVGYADLTLAYLNPGTFGGVDVSAQTQWIARYCYQGDADMNGVTNANDFTNFLDGFSLAQPANWSSGDFDYNAVVNANDFTRFLDGFAASNLGGTLGSIAEGGAKLGSSVVPEPGSLGLLLVGALGFLGRRQRRSKIN